MNISTKIILSIISLILFITVIFIGIKPKLTSTVSTSTDHQLTVATSFYPLYYFASQIGGSKARVINITPAGAEPHDYDLSTYDMAQIDNSQLLILNGGIESWGDKVKSALSGDHVVIVTAGNGLLSQSVIENGTGQTDPHVWLDPILAEKEVSAITSGFIKVDPQDTNYFRENEATLNNKLDQLDKSYQQGLTGCKKNSIVTSHAAFGYLATRYGLKQISVAGLSPDAEPSAKQLANIANFISQNQVKYIFFESLITPKLAQTLASETGAQTLVLDPIEGVSLDSQNQGANYFTIMQNNLHNLQIALECSKM